MNIRPSRDFTGLVKAYSDPLAHIERQSAPVLDLLRRGDTVTARDAERYGVENLSECIRHLERSGNVIVRDFDEVRKCATYRMEQQA